MTEPTASLIVTALRAEADPLIDHFKLIKDTTRHAFETFHRDSLSLVVTGVGKVRSAIATAAFLALQPNSGMAAINIGIAGAAPASGLTLGNIYLIHKITDAATSRELFPDLLVSADLKEAALTTVDRPVRDPEAIDVDRSLVDMEGAGFFEAASTFVPPHAIGCLKVVSDHLDGKHPRKAEVRGLVAGHVPAIEDFLTNMERVVHKGRSLIGDAEARWMETLTSYLRLTVSQQRQLRDSVWRYLARHGPSLPSLSSSDLAAPGSKRERNARFDQLRNRLAAEG